MKQESLARAFKCIMNNKWLIAKFTVGWFLLFVVQAGTAIFIMMLMIGSRIGNVIDFEIVHMAKLFGLSGAVCNVTPSHKCVRTPVHDTVMDIIFYIIIFIPICCITLILITVFMRNIINMKWRLFVALICSFIFMIIASQYLSI